MRRVVVLTLLVLVASCSPEAKPAAAPPPAEATVPPTPSPASPTPSATPDATEPSPRASEAATPVGTDEVLAYYVRSGPANVFVEPVTRTLDEPTLGVAAAAVEELLSGDPEDPGLRTLAPVGTTLLDATIADAVLTIDLSGEVTANPNAGAAGETAFAQQLAHTGAQFDTVDSVRLLVDGEPVTDLWGHLDWSQPIVSDEFALSPIVVASPAWGTTVDAGEVTVAGTANTFEATVELRLLDADGTVVTETFTTATCGTGCRGDWSHTFTGVDAPGRWTVVATAPDPSGGAEGPGPFTTETTFEVG